MHCPLIFPLPADNSRDSKSDGAHEQRTIYMQTRTKDRDRQSAESPQRRQRRVMEGQENYLEEARRFGLDM